MQELSSLVVCRAGYFRLLASMGIKQFNLAALLVIGSKWSFRGGLDAQKMYLLSSRPLFPHASEWEKVLLGRIASRDGHHSLVTMLALFLGAWLNPNLRVQPGRDFSSFYPSWY